MHSFFCRYIYPKRLNEMISLETQYFNLNKTLLRALGLWPYQQSKLVQFQFILFSGILATAIIFQVRHYSAFVIMLLQEKATVTCFCMYNHLYICNHFYFLL